MRNIVRNVCKLVRDPVAPTNMSRKISKCSRNIQERSRNWRALVSDHYCRLSHLYHSSLIPLGDTKNEVRRAEIEVQVKQAYTLSHKLYQYYKWYSLKSPEVRFSLPIPSHPAALTQHQILTKKDCVCPQSVYPSPPLPLSGDFSKLSKHRTFRTNIIFPNAMP